MERYMLEDIIQKKLENIGVKSEREEIVRRDKEEDVSGSQEKEMNPKVKIYYGKVDKIYKRS